jgi:putative phage-type endonuclease
MKLINTENMPHEEWLQHRREGIGGSDVGIILGLNPYMSRIQLFYQKLGMYPEQILEDENQSVFFGKLFEDKIRNIAQYYDFAYPKAYMQNHRLGNRLRYIYAFPYMGLSEKYPWLRGNFDGVGLDNPHEGQIEDISPEYITEIKTISGRAADIWENGIPPAYITQVLTYMLIWEDVNPDIYGHLYSLRDGNVLEGNYIEPNRAIQDRIIEETFDFSELVKKGWEIVENASNTDQAMVGLQEIEPGPDDTKAYYDFMSERAREKELWNVIQGTDEIYNLAVKYKEIGGQIKELEKLQLKPKNEIIKELTDNEAKMIDFGELGKISYSNRLYINVK